MVLCAGAFGGYAAQGSLPGAQGQGYDLNLSYSRTTLKAVADAITQQAGIAFSYETALAGYPMENLEVSEKGATIEAILATVFTPRGIDYRVVDKVVVLTRSTRPVPAARAAAKSEVKGVVRDAAGNPMIGVTVTIKGTLVGVSTGVDGGYAIPADGNATLLFSYIGYRPHEEVVGRRTQIDVTMQEDELVMDEVVVVGYGTLKKRNIVGAVENLSGDAVENRPNANITRSLQGQIPGLNIVQVDGKADHAGEVTIRGVNNTFKARVSGGEKTNKLGQGGGALVLIDGAEGDMGSVNPDDIASISVLKDASSAAVYGARGAFGVILITTKNPEKGKVRVSYNGSVSLHRRTVIWEDNVVTDPVQWVDAFRESYLNSSPTATVPSLFNNYMPYSNAWFEELKRRRADPTMDNYDIDANGNYNYYGETNWLKEIYKSVNYSTTHAVSIQGGREGVSYYISGRYYNQDGIYKVGEETYKKYNLRAKGSIRIRPWLTLDNNTSLMSIKQLQPGGDWSMYHNIMLSVRSVEEALYYWEHGIRNVMFCVEISSMEHFRAYDASPIPWKYIMAYIRLAVNPDLQPVYDLLHAEGVMTMTSITGSSDKVKNPYDRRVAYLRELVAEPDIIETDYPSEFIGLPWSRDAIHALQEAAMRSHRTNLK